MAEYRDEKRRLIHSIIKKGVEKENFIDHAEEIGVAVPNDVVSKWKTRFYSSSKFDLPSSPRLINRFCVGADPEFVFGKVVTTSIGVNETKYSHAEKHGLTTLEAFGSDMCGRMAELRAHPSRFVLEVVASLMDTLRWCAESFPSACSQDWYAPAFFVNDGVGGHVHIGRKKKDYKADVRSLNLLHGILLNTSVFDSVGHSLRVSQTNYGKLGDIRHQFHGYEYRTMPSWLYSPWAAYLTLVLSKLAVFHNIGTNMAKSPQTGETIRNLLRAYQNEDDDARIALRAMTLYGMPQYVFQDFKVNWGVPQKSSRSVVWDQTFFPTTIEPEGESIYELFAYLTQGKALKVRVPKPTWEPFVLSNDSYKLRIQAHVYGLPEVGQGMLCKGVPVLMQRGAHKIISMIVPHGFHVEEKAMKKSLLEYPAIKTFHLFSQPANTLEEQRLVIRIPPNIHNDNEVNKNVVKDLRGFFTKSGLFPLVMSNNYDKLNPAQFFEKKKKVVPMLGKALGSVEGEVEPVVKRKVVPDIQWNYDEEFREDRR